MTIKNYKILCPLSEDSKLDFLLVQYIRNQIFKIEGARVFCIHSSGEIVIMLEQSLTEASALEAWTLTDLIYNKFQQHRLILELLAPTNIQEFASAMQDLETSNQATVNTDLPALTFE